MVIGGGLANVAMFLTRIVSVVLMIAGEALTNGYHMVNNYPMHMRKGKEIASVHLSVCQHQKYARSGDLDIRVTENDRKR